MCMKQTGPSALLLLLLLLPKVFTSSGSLPFAVGVLLCDRSGPSSVLSQKMKTKSPPKISLEFQTEKKIHFNFLAMSGYQLMEHISGLLGSYVIHQPTDPSPALLRYFLSDTGRTTWVSSRSDCVMQHKSTEFGTSAF